ncbi:probable beta-D-xylosidase 2 isoform X1 [Corvus moneduloides]|nr:probable beta-D-xylosidase 2 isoform X1 [Corvus moneduloides]
MLRKTGGTERRDLSPRRGPAARSSGIHIQTPMHRAHLANRPGGRRGPGRAPCARPVPSHPAALRPVRWAQDRLQRAPPLRAHRRGLGARGPGRAVLCRSREPGRAMPCGSRGPSRAVRRGARPGAALGLRVLVLSAALGAGAVRAQPPPFPFWDPSLPWHRRLDDLLGRLSPAELVLQVARGGAMGNGPAPPIPRLGISPYNWNTECLRGDAEAPGWATAFPQALGLAAAFSPELIYRVANATATEVRAKHNSFAAAGRYSDHTGLSCFSPVLNIMRHPLWGRNQETYGEDPFLSGELARSFVQGLQGQHPRYVKASAGCKHFSVHGGPENIPVSRLSFDAKVLERDWRMTFLPQFQACVRAGSYSFMCSYNRINGVPACANKKLLTDILRGEWGFDGYVVSDEGAVELIMLGHHYTRTFLETAVASVNAGCNLELSYGMRNNVFMCIPQALAMGNITLQMLRDRVRPLFYTRMRLGEFDPPAMNPYSSLDLSVVQSPEHRNLSLEAAVKSFVLLKNVRGTLPLRAQDLSGQRLAVVGPFADNPRVLFGDYAPVPEPQYIYTPRRGLEMLGANVSFTAGCSEPRCQQYSRAELVRVVGAADVVLICLGTGVDVETEAKDRSDLSLPGHQLELLQDAVQAAAGRPVILLLFNAGPLDVSWAQAHDSVGAILACFFPAQATGLAIARVLLGEAGASPAGRLPATWPAGMHQVPPMENYTMEGRTYRYYGQEAPLYPFGYGLSYTTFRYRDLVLSPPVLPVCANLSVSVVLVNTGLRDSEEVVQLYLRWEQSSVPVPRWQLVAFRRVAVLAGRETKLSFQVLAEQRAVWAQDWRLEPGTFTLFAGGQQPGQKTRAPSEVLSARFSVTGTARPLRGC